MIARPDMELAGGRPRAVVDVERLQRDLEAIVGPRRMSVRAVDLDTYARDMWPRLLLSYREGRLDVPRPHAVVWPEHVREIVAIVKLAREHRIPIVPYGGGSGVCGGAVPLFGGITIDTKRMQQLRSVHSDELICDVDAGLNGERFERVAATRSVTSRHRSTAPPSAAGLPRAPRVSCPRSTARSRIALPGSPSSPARPR
jgi:FAD/FMN-containing dehydrogenase